MADNLTPRQQEILQLIRDTVELEGRPPTRAEICTAFGFRSPNAAETHLRALAAKEKQMAKQVDLNLALKRISAELASAREQL